MAKDLDIEDAVAPHPRAREQLTSLLEDNARLRKAVEDWHDAAVRAEREVARLLQEHKDIWKKLSIPTDADNVLRSKSGDS